MGAGHERERELDHDSPLARVAITRRMRLFDRRRQRTNPAMGHLLREPVMGTHSSVLLEADFASPED
jgi:hypothetical protein